MEVLACDLCGGKLKMDSGGIAICESCGMEHTLNRMKEKVCEIKGSVKIDNSHMIDNYLEIINSAYESKNYVEAELYCNKIIEIEPNNHKAWVLKGKSAGWQSTLQNPRLAESVNTFIRTIKNTPEEEKMEIIEEAKEEIRDISKALIELRTENFIRYPDEEEATKLEYEITNISNLINQFFKQCNINISTSDFLYPIANEISNAVNVAWENKILPDYVGNGGYYNEYSQDYLFGNSSMFEGPDERPDDDDWKEFISRIENCTILLEKVVNIFGEDNEENLSIYEKILFLQKQALISQSWSYYINSYGYKVWSYKSSLNDNDLTIKRNLIEKYTNKINSIKTLKESRTAEEKQKRFELYWSEHIKEKNSLELEKKNICEQIEEIKSNSNKKINLLKADSNDAQAEKEIDEIDEKISKLKEEKMSFSVLNFKERYEIKVQIDKLKEEQKDKVNKMICNQLEYVNKIDFEKREMQLKLSPLEERLNIINNELTRDR